MARKNTSTQRTQKAMRELKAIQKTQRKLERRESALVKVIARERDKYAAALAACEGSSKKKASKKKASKKKASKKKASKKKASKKKASKKKAKARSPASLTLEVLRGLRRSSGLTFLPEVFRALEPDQSQQTTRAAILDLFRAGKVELRPEGGLNRLTASDKRLTLPGPQGTLLAWARVTS